MKRDGTVVRLQRFATLNAIAHPTKLSRTLAYGTSPAGGHCGHSPPYASQGVAQLPVTKDMRLGCPVYVCGGGPRGSYIFGLEQQLCRAVQEPYAEDLAGEMAPAK